MNEKKFVTMEMFEEYHKKLVGYIEERDGLIFDDEEDDLECDSEDDIVSFD